MKLDDHAINRLVVSTFLSDHINIVEAENGRLAMDFLEAGEMFDLMILDIRMPEMDGVEVMKRVRSSNAAYRKLPIIVLTADAMIGDREKYLSYGANGYVVKPVEHDLLVNEINAVLADHTEPSYSD